MADCIFCRIVHGELPASVIYRDERCMAFMVIHPINAGHTLVIALRHAAHLADLDPKDGAHIFRGGQQVAGALRSQVGGPRCEGVNLFLADGRVAGQDVYHVHLHVIPRYLGDGFGLRLPRHYGSAPARSELDQISAALRARLHIGPATAAPPAPTLEE